MKRIICMAVVLLYCASNVVAQVRATDKFGNKKLLSTGTEPWQIVGTTTPANDINTSGLYQNANVAIGDFSTGTLPVEKLEIAGSFRVRALADALTLGAVNSFPLKVVAKSDGTFGYAPRLKVQVATSSVVRLEIDTDVLLIPPGLTITTYQFPSTEAEGAYNGRVVYIRNDGPAGTKGNFNTFAGAAYTYLGMALSGSGTAVQAYGYNQIPSRVSLKIMYTTASGYNLWVVNEALTGFLGSNR